MGRRPAPLDPAASPIAAFASALRELRDDLGPTAPTVDDVVIGAASLAPPSTRPFRASAFRLRSSWPRWLNLREVTRRPGLDCATRSTWQSRNLALLTLPMQALRSKNVASETSELALKPPPGVPSYSKGSDGLRELGAVVVALERGDWRSALLLLSETGIDAPGWVNVQHCLKLVAYSMRLQCGTADVMVATQYLDSAKRALTGAIGGQWRRASHRGMTIVLIWYGGSRDLSNVRRRTLQL